MNYKVKYFLYYTFVLSMIFMGVILIAGIKEMISTKSFKVIIDLPNIHFAFINILAWSFLISFIVMPFYAKPSKETFAFQNNIEKKYIFERVDKAVKVTMKESNVMKRRRIEAIGDKVIYSCNTKILNYLFQPIIVYIDENTVTVDSNIFFIKKIGKVLNKE